MRSRAIIVLAQGVALAVGAVALASSARSQTVGETTAVNPASSGAGETLIVGAHVIHNEHIRTDAKGSVQILFLDRTTMSIGPNSALDIDDYVYDPKTGTGKMSVKLVSGLMRFVGGQVTHTGEAEITTPYAAIGVRGGTGQFAITPKGTQAIFLGGNSPDAGLTVTPCPQTNGAGRGTALFCNVTPGGPGSQNLTVPGFGVMAGLGSVATPALVEVQTLAAQNAALSSRGGQTGGAGGQTAAAVVHVANTFGGAIASNVIAVNATTTSAAANNAASSQSAGAVNSPLNTVLLNTTQTVQTTTTTTTSQANAQTTGQQMATTAQPFVLAMSNCCGAGNPTGIVPYLPSGYAFSGNYVVSPVLGYRPASSTGTVANAPWFQAGINITGTGAGQSSWMFVATGAFGSDGNGGLVSSGGFVATRRAAADLTPGRADGSLATLPNTTPQAGVQFDPLTMLPTGGTIDNSNYAFSLNSYVTPVQANYTTGANRTTLNTDTNYNLTQTFSAIAPPTGLGGIRPAVTLNGYVGGLMQSNTGGINGPAEAPPFVVLNQSLLPSDVTIQLDPTTSRMQANINVARFTGTNANSFDFASYQFGSLASGTPYRSAYVDYDDFAAREAVSTTSTSPTSITETPISSVNGVPFTNQVGTFLNVSSAAAQQIGAGIPSNTVTFCQCDYTKWGFWSTDESYGGNIGDVGHMMLWVAGQLAKPSDVPTTGIATYAGHAIANIANGTGNLPNQYIAAGNFTNTVNFGTQTGNVTVTSLDNTNYSGTVSLIPSSTSFAGALVGNNGGRGMVLNGSFFRGTASPVGEMGGQIAITGTNYLGSGIFAAKMQ